MTEVPPDRCGYTYGHTDHETISDIDSNCCFRETLPDRTRCIWHSDDGKKTGHDLPDPHNNEVLDGAILSDLVIGDEISLSNVSLRSADLSGVTLTDTVFDGADLGGADLKGSKLLRVNLNGADLRGANLRDISLLGVDLNGGELTATNLSEAHIQYTNINNADMKAVDLTDSRIIESELKETNLERSELMNTDLFGTNITGANFYNARLIGVQINPKTQFDSERDTYATWREQLIFRSPIRCGYDKKLRDNGGFDEDKQEELLNKAADTYRQFEELARNNTLPSLQSSMFVRRQEMQRKRHKMRGDYVQWAFAGISRAVFKHGESLGRISAWAIGLIIGYAAVYDLFNLIVDSDGAFVQSFVDSLYFSTLTFTTLGLGDFQPDPVSQLARLLVTSQAALGATLIAIFVFVLGRRAAR
jgi:uncharacterized protein YjbI with pentapeptide repeats